MGGPCAIGDALAFATNPSILFVELCCAMLLRGAIGIVDIFAQDSANTRVPTVLHYCTTSCILPGRKFRSPTRSVLIACDTPQQNRERFSERIGNVADKVEHCDVHMAHGAGASVNGYLVADPSSSKPKEESALSKTTHGR